MPLVYNKKFRTIYNTFLYTRQLRSTPWKSASEFSTNHVHIHVGTHTMTTVGHQGLDL